MARGDIKEKVRKLLNQAEDQQGTAEAAVFYEKAFALMARHGFDERDLGSGKDPGMERFAHEFQGSYSEMQMNLLNVIARGLHCSAVAVRRARAVGVVSAQVFGVTAHVERVEMLFALLNPIMAGRANGAGRSVAQRRSFMEGFAAEISIRLTEAEAQVREEHQGYGLALIDDEKRATDFMNESVQVTSSHQRRSSSIDAESYMLGAVAARDMDLGQSRIAGARGLPRAS